MRTKHFLICGLVAAIATLPGCGQFADGQERSTVTVSGVGTVSVEPDMVRMAVLIGKTGQTTRLAQEAVGRMAAGVLAILNDSGIEDKDITTASLTFNPQYEWHGNRNVLVGQRAEQGIDFAVRGIGQDNEKVARIIDRLADIDGIMINSIEFDLADNTGHFVRSRELAFEKAMQKAQQYAALSGLSVGRVLNLSEDVPDSAAPLYGNRAVNKFTMEQAAMDVASTILPTGQIEITTRISVVFTLE